MPRPERPLDAAQDAVQHFAAELRELRERAGKPTYRQLAERSGYAVSTVSEAAGGRRLPTLDVALAYAVACGGDKQEWAAKWQIASLAATEIRSARSAGGENRPPYCGLSSFRTEDADLFFGRERLVADVVERIAAHPVTVVLGPSGAGKSSLLAAGVLPALRGTGTESVVLTPGSRPPASLAEALPDGEVLVVVDQFEELYTLCDADERTAFIDGLLALAGDRVRLVLVVRADFYGRCAEHLGLLDVLRENQVLVGPMGREELCAAVSRPALSVGLSVERALLVMVVNEAQGQAGVLPLLSHALLETWRRRRGDVLTAAGFTAAGGINAAVARTAETAFGALDPAVHGLAAELLLRLLTLDESTGAAVRRRADLAELLDVAPEAEVVINRLACARLITVDLDTVEIAHEAVLTAWPRLRGWIDDHRDALRVHRAVVEATRIWAEHGHDPTTLATGARLELLSAYAGSDTAPVRLSREERAFVEESTAQVRRAEAAVRRRSRRLRTVTALAVVCAIVAGLLAVVAGNARTEALQARNNALSRQLALTAGKLRGTDPGLAAQLSIAGYRIARTTEARSALLESSDAVLPARYLGGAGPTALDASADGSVMAVSNATDGTVQLFTRTPSGLSRARRIVPRQLASAAVYALALSPDGRMLAIGDKDGTITLWDVADPWNAMPLTGALSAPGGPVERLDIDAGGTQLAAASGDRILRWGIGDPANPKPLPPLLAPSTTKTVTYGTGGLVAFGTEAGTVHLWNDGGTELAVLNAGGGPVPAVSISPDGRTLVAGAHDRSLQSWDISSPRTPEPLKRPTALFDLKITTTAFSPDGRYLVAGSADSTIRVLDATTWATLQTLPHPDVVSWATFTDNGASIASAASDGALRVWPMSLTRRADAPIGDTPFSDDGTRLAVFAEGGASVWDTSAVMKPLVTGLTATGATFSGAGDLSGGGTLLAAGTTGGEVHLLDVADPAHPHLLARLGGSRDEVTAVAFSPDGTMLAAAGRDSAVRLWHLADLPRPRLAAVLDAPADLVLDLDWHPSGKVLAAASGDSIVYLFDVTGTPRLSGRLEGLESYAYSATFNPAGTVLAVGGVDSVVVLWDVRDLAAPRRIGHPLDGPTGRIFELSFHPRGDVLAAAVIDGSTWLWNVADPANATRTAVLSAAGSPVNTAVFRPSGDLLLTGGGDRTLRAFRTDADAVIAAVCGGAGDPLTEREWHTYVPELPHTPVCPRP
ncbi:helix-turn-helix domain-containing protein [Lentzea sp.]|uniref:nSTAND1 domain-containing NTPase n=1 Tax=Lentzea sp. TaxID=56099 RepID=UPI002BC9B48E|nr:helix-turn-helix domain-containing protein [Lentzea sp.]HUQ61186.1 helix-turn-helix domain-containing protein [Lentzea sp.]